MDEFRRLREQLELEMSDRFDNQDEILDNLSNTIKTFQDTMKIVGQTVFWFKFPLHIAFAVGFWGFGVLGFWVKDGKRGLGSKDEVKANTFEGEFSRVIFWSKTRHTNLDLS